MDEFVEISALLGRTFTHAGPVTPPRWCGIGPNDNVIEFRCADGTSFLMYHEQDCCEDVHLDFAVGEWGDLVGEPILRAEESSGQHDADEEDPTDESGTWTFYKLATRKGYMDLRWIGTSNGYYSERVDLRHVLTATLTPAWTQEN